MSESKKTVLVVGGGITGISCALNLLDMNRSVILVDPQEPQLASSWGNGGILARSAVVPVPVPGIVKNIPRLLFDPDSPLMLSYSYLLRMGNWLRRYLGNASEAQVRYTANNLHPLLYDSIAQHQNLAKSTGALSHIKESPYLFLYPDKASVAADRLTWEIRKQHGYDPELVVGKKLEQLAPGVAKPDTQGLLLRDHALIDDPGRYIAALTEHLGRSGTRLLKGRVAELRPGTDGVSAMVNGVTQTADSAVVCAGVWSWQLVRPLGCKVALESERGYHLELPGPSPFTIPIMDARRKVVATPMAGRTRLAGLVDFGGLTRPPHRRAEQRMQQIAREIMPDNKLTEARFWMGHRPAPWDSLPLLGTVPASRRIVVATGMHHIGMTAGPKLGLLAAQISCGQETAISVTPYDPARQ